MVSLSNHQTRLGRLVSEAGIDPAKTLAQFDFAAVPQLKRTLVLDLASCTYLGRAENILLSGPTGTGKSHLANALAWEAVKRNQTALCRSAQRLLADLQAARATGTFARRFARLCAVDLLVLDDFGLRPLGAQGSEDLYELIRERYERKSLVITSNLQSEGYWWRTQANGHTGFSEATPILFRMGCYL